MHQYATLEDTIYFGFAANLTSGSANDGATPLFDVRKGGDAAGAIPILSGTPTLLTHANYSDGCYEVAVAATAANGFVSGGVYLVFVTLTIDSVTPAACIGSFILAPAPSNLKQVNGAAQTATLDTIKTDTAAVKVQTDKMAFTVANQIDANVLKIGGTTQTAGDLAARLPAALTVDGLIKADTLRVGGTLQTAGDIYALDTLIASYIDTEIGNIQSRLPAALTVDGLMKADTLRVGGTLQTAGDLAALIAALPTAAVNADKFLGRSLAAGADSATRNVANALRALRNKVAIVAGTATIYQEDDIAVAWTAAISTTAGDPISTVDPA